MDRLSGAFWAELPEAYSRTDRGYLVFSEFVHWFAGVTVINISSCLMPAAVLILESWLLIWLGEGCISHLESAVAVAHGS